MHLVSRWYVNGRDRDVLACLRGAGLDRRLGLPGLRRRPPARALRGPALLRHSQLAGVLAIIRASARRCTAMTLTILAGFLSILSRLTIRDAPDDQKITHSGAVGFMPPARNNLQAEGIYVLFFSVFFSLFVAFFLFFVLTPKNNKICNYITAFYLFICKPSQSRRYPR